MTHADDPPAPRCWVISDGRAGIENQALGLAEAVGLPFAVKRVHPRAPWRWLPPGWWPAPLASLGDDGDDLAPPYPELIIGCGRRAVPLTMAIRRAAAGRSFVVQLQHPRVSPRHFDLVVPPMHDRLHGANVIATLGSLHRVTPARIAAAARRLAPQVAALPRPLATVLIGGTSKAYRMTPAVAETLAAQLARLAAEAGAGLLVTTSRRTGEDNARILRERLAGLPAMIWDGRGENPYFGYLGLADHLLVTCDSVAMLSEACATGKPVQVIPLDGGSRKFRDFHAALYAAGLARPFTGRLEHWTYRPPDEPGRVAAEIRRRMGL